MIRILLALLIGLLCTTVSGQTITKLTVTNGSTIYSIEIDGKVEIVDNPTIYLNGRPATMGVLVDRMSQEELKISLANNIIQANSNFTSLNQETVQEVYYVQECGPFGCQMVPRVRNVVRNVATATVNTMHTILPPYQVFNAGCNNPNCTCGQSMAAAQNYFVNAQGLTARQARVLARRARWMLFWR